MSLHESIIADIQRVHDELAGCVGISPTTIAVRVLQKYSSAKKLEPHVEYTSLEHLKQMSRKVLAARHDPDGEENQAHQGELFSGHLQDRYPIPRKQGEEPVYKLREALTDAEVAWNIATLRKSAEARLLHADALEAWHQSRVQAA